jgi:hydroxypyruvate isomerase
MDFSVCVEMIFDALPLEERIAQAGACGAAAVEFWTWRDKDLDAIARAKETAGVNISAFGGLSGKSPSDPSAVGSAVDELRHSVEAARQIGSTGLIVYGGQEQPELPREQQLESLKGVLAATAEAADQAHVMLLLEPRNARVDFPGELLTSTDEALKIVTDLDLPNVKLLFDIYHQYVTEGSVHAAIETNIDRIGHFHMADAPGRGEPGTGALDFGEVFRLIDSLGYEGYMGLEFRPSGDPAKAVRKTIELA